MFGGAGEGLNVRLATSIKLFLEPDAVPSRNDAADTRGSASYASEELLSVADTLRKYANTDECASSPTAVASEEKRSPTAALAAPLRGDRNLRIPTRASEARPRSASNKMGKKTDRGRSAARPKAAQERKRLHQGRQGSKATRKQESAKEKQNEVVVSRAASRRARKHQARATAVSTLRDYTTATPANRKSFIESITVNENECWGAPPLEGSPEAKKQAHTSTMSPLPRRVARELYLKDAPTLDETSSQAPSQHHGFYSSPDLTFPRWDGFPNNSSKPVNDVTTGLSNEAGDALFHHFWGTSGEPPANVVFPGGSIHPSKITRLKEKSRHNDVWHVEDGTPAEKANLSSWKQPLQEFGDTEEKPGERGELAVTLANNRMTYTETFDDYQNVFYRLWSCSSSRGHVGFLRNLSDKAGSTGAVGEQPNSLVACSAILRDPQGLLVSRNLNSMLFAMGSQRGPEGSLKKWWLASGGDSAATLDKQTILDQGSCVELSYAARILYVALLYIRTLGGFPTLQRITPLSDSSTVVEKENCLELVFATTRFSPGGKRGKGMQEVNFREERSVIVRSVLAEKSCVERFGKREVVHVLPLLNESVGDAPERVSMQTITSAAAGKSFVGFHPRSDKQPTRGPEPSYTAAASSPRLNGSALNSLKERAVDYGDIAVAFLMSVEASKLSGVLPEPMEIEGLRYRVFILDSCKNYRKPQVNVFKNEVGSDTERWINNRMGAFEIELLRKREEARAAQAAHLAQVSLQEMLLKINGPLGRFPWYRPMTIAESTLAKADKESSGTYCTHSDDVQTALPRFYQLRLPRLHQDLAYVMCNLLGISLTMVPCPASGGQSQPSSFYSE
ncbi:hypothetical protein, conserved [Trypanosoma brucei gambiense DAL972]|uniref:Uncharacterized protein n=1 Tax=Trypanosoma brucei gambiense (strain MHOM/CI/86/DAL972) TaxID=679716 RepID=C9ZRV5_TRYB9|nr:hypothetical protein, conserved [Trypanosoma brucei gambiense DAL972]CBH12091.1 hypothetical protein, conserved [Trypanosoma brucei gambiense DAL972]|eukprot:XP_011774374.1 hypothetical protein, conserved [Trypanosoma brucei gambiense DAL972]